MNDDNSFNNLDALNQNHRKIRLVLSQLSENIESNYELYTNNIEVIIFKLLSYYSLGEEHHRTYNDFINFMRILQLTALELSVHIKNENSDIFLEKILSSETIDITVKLIFINWICIPNEKEKVQLNESQVKVYKEKICDIFNATDIKFIITGNYGAFVFNYIGENCNEQLVDNISDFLNKGDRNVLRIIKTYRTFYSSSNEGIVNYIDKKGLYKITYENDIKRRIKELKNLTDYENGIIEMFNKNVNR